MQNTLHELISQFLKELNHNNDMSSHHKYSLQVSNVTLDRLLTVLVDEIDIPDNEDIVKAVYTLGKNTNSEGQLV